jgi:hypothetical protein
MNVIKYGVFVGIGVALMLISLFAVVGGFWYAAEQEALGSYPGTIMGVCVVSIGFVGGAGGASIIIHVVMGVLDGDIQLKPNKRQATPYYRTK